MAPPLDPRMMYVWYVCMYVYMCVYMYVCIGVCVCMYVYMYVCIAEFENIVHLSFSPVGWPCSVEPLNDYRPNSEIYIGLSFSIK